MLLHQTDLFRPHNDPDDHWDLACAFAIAARGSCPLAGVLIDHPPGPPILNHRSDPDIGAVAQLSHLTGIHPPVAIGSAGNFSARGDALSRPSPVGVEFVIRMLRESREPVAISIVGSARDIAEALVRAPGVFAGKCAGIYLVCGSGSPDPGRVPSLEWNVALDPAAYGQIFKAPCPVFWLPCLEDEDRVASPESREYAGHFHFEQKPMLDRLPRGLRNYFAFMYAKCDSSFWLSALEEDFEAVLSAEGPKHRMMYSTPLFFDAAGLGVTVNGEIRGKAEMRDDWVYRFEPIEVQCDQAGVTRWAPAEPNPPRRILHVLDTAAYAPAMTRAMGMLLSEAFGR